MRRSTIQVQMALRIVLFSCSLRLKKFIYYRFLNFQGDHLESKYFLLWDPMRFVVKRL